ncbi:MAG: hypothetical protein CMM94_04410 [Rickettsiales bacterium]|nr:hypothetical protein [Rickettsiales bacterium]|tara:strand:- start:58 stop:951 length:894 start_codon:yes stop_codon:yes gene_type:complete
MPKKRGKFFYSACLVLGFITMTVFLALGTALSTFEDIWQKQGRVESTKYEFFISHFIGGARNKIIQSGTAPDTWYVQLLTGIDRWAYERAIKKVPENNFERLFWHYKRFVEPKISLPKERYREALPFLVHDAVDKLSVIDEYEITSPADRDVYYPKIVNTYSSYIVGYGEEYITNNYSERLSLALNKTCDIARKIDLEKIKQYDLDSYLDGVFWIMSRSYNRLTSAISQDDRGCSSALAQCWLDTSNCVSQFLIQDNQLASYLQGSSKTSDSYKAFIRYYQHEDSYNRERIANKCAL